MKITSGRIRSVGLNPGNGLSLGYVGDVAIPSCDPTNDMACLQNGPVSFTNIPTDQASVTTTDASWLNSPGFVPSSSDPATAHAVAAKAPVSNSNMTVLLGAAVGGLVLLMMLKK